MEPRRYRLKKPTLGVCSDGGKRWCVTVPRDEVIEIQRANISKNNATVEIKWGDRALTMFSEDVLERGIEV